MKVVHIEWLDASCTGSWTDLNDIQAFDQLTHTVGMLLKETETMAIIAATYDPSTQSANAIMSIPLCCIKEMRTICQIKTT